MPAVAGQIKPKLLPLSRNTIDATPFIPSSPPALFPNQARIARKHPAREAISEINKCSPPYCTSLRDSRQRSVYYSPFQLIIIAYTLREDIESPYHFAD